MELKTRLLASVFGWTLGALLLVLPACSRNSGSSPQGGSVTVSPTQESIQRDFVNVSCVGCHSQPTSKNRNVGLGDISALVVGHPHDHEAGTMPRMIILPGCPKQSLFLSILKEGKMPPRGAISQATLQAIETWIISLKPDAGKSCESDEPNDDESGTDEPEGGSGR